MKGYLQPAVLQGAQGGKGERNVPSNSFPGQKPKKAKRYVDIIEEEIVNCW